jgi:hypothetical protein
VCCTTWCETSVLVRLTQPSCLHCYRAPSSCSHKKMHAEFISRFGKRAECLGESVLSHQLAERAAPRCKAGHTVCMSNCAHGFVYTLQHAKQGHRCAMKVIVLCQASSGEPCLQ